MNKILVSLRAKRSSLLKDCFVATLLAMTPILAFATPPVSISLNYDPAKGSLHVEAIHPSYNLEKSYVRLMIVYVNDSQVSNLNYFKQTDNNKFIDDVPVTAQAGDVIKVDLFCAEGGEMAQELTVTQAGASQPDQSTAADTTNSTTDNTEKE